MSQRVEPLFAHNIQLWLRVWMATQATALVAASFISALNRGFVLMLGLLVAYHIVGFLGYNWILRRLPVVLLFVTLGWVLTFAAFSQHTGFSLLIFGAIIQGFIFLPFAWAMAALTLVVALILTAITRTARPPRNLVLTQIGGVLATGVMIATVLLYIHRTNRDATVRADLIRRLDAAQRDLADRAREAGALEERQRLSRDIHDTLAQAFASVIRHLEAVQLALLAPSSNEDNPVARAVLPHLAHAQSVSRDSLAEIRRVVLALRPVELTDALLPGAIGRIVQQWGDANGVRAESSSDPLPPFHPDADVIFLRAVQESLSNVARHAAASHVRVTLSCVDELVLLTVDDDGCGFEQADTKGQEKLGLSGMRERVRRFGGHVLIESSPGAGTSLTVALPLTAIAARPA